MQKSARKRGDKRVSLEMTPENLTRRSTCVPGVPSVPEKAVPFVHTHYKIR